MAVVADMANAIRDGKLGSVTGALLHRQEQLDNEITTRVGRLVAAQQDRMARLRDSVTAANHRSLILTSAFAVSAVIFALLCGFVISWSFILPVREAQGFLDKVAAGSFGERISVPNRDEFGALAERMNHMSQELQRFDTEQRLAAAELGRLNQQLAQTSKEKSDFLANMSHELRTPMNAILGFTEMVLDGLYGDVPTELKEPLADIQVKYARMLEPCTLQESARRARAAGADGLVVSGSRTGEPPSLDELSDCLADHFDVEHSTFQLEPASHVAHELGAHP